MKQNYNAAKRRKELDRKKKKAEKDEKKQLRREALARGEMPEGEEELIAEYTATALPESSEIDSEPTD